MTITTLDSQAARENWGVLLAMVAKGDKSIVITEDGEPVAALVDYTAFMALAEELDDLQATQRAATILEDIRTGRTATVPWEDVKADLIAEGLLDG